MNARIAVILAAVLSLAACADGKKQSTLNEASTATGTGNTRGSSIAPGPQMNSQSATEAARESTRR